MCITRIVIEIQTRGEQLANGKGMTPIDDKNTIGQCGKEIGVEETNESIAETRLTAVKTVHKKRSGVAISAMERVIIGYEMTRERGKATGRQRRRGMRNNM